MKSKLFVLPILLLLLGGCSVSGGQGRAPKGKVFDNTYTVLGHEIRGQYLFRQVVFEKDRKGKLQVLTTDYPLSEPPRVLGGAAAYMVGFTVINPGDIFYQLKEKVYFRESGQEPWPREPIVEVVHPPPRDLKYSIRFFHAPFDKVGEYRFHVIIINDMGYPLYEERVRYDVVK